MKRFQAKYKLKNSSNISEIWKNRDKYLSAYSNPIGSPLRKTLKSTKLIDIDKGLVNFISNCNSSVTMINENMLREKALDIANLLNITDFKSSHGYLEKFKKRNQIIFTKIHGDASSVDSDVIETWYGSQLKDHIHLVDPDNIYNGDESGLFWRMHARSSYAIKDKICKFEKQSKDRMMKIWQSLNH